MTRDQLTKVLDEHKSMTGSNDFFVCFADHDLGAVMGRLRHFKEKDMIIDYQLAEDVGECYIQIIGYGA